MNLWLANPRGFCAGVERAVRVVDELLALSQAPVYVRHEIVHNRAVVDGLRARGAVFVEDTEAIPEGALAVISAHGAAPPVHRAAARGRQLFDATCPLVTKVHLEVQAHARAGRSVLLVGHRGHVEVEGTIGWFRDAGGAHIVVVETAAEAETVQVADPAQVAYVTQTTLAVDAAQRIVDVLRRRFPALVAPHHDDICYATQNRQDAVRALAARCQCVIVVGAPHSSNSVRMVEVAAQGGSAAYLVETPADIRPEWLQGVTDLGLSSSASAPEHLVQGAVARLRELAPGLELHEFGTREDLSFKLPAALTELRELRDQHDRQAAALPSPPPSRSPAMSTIHTNVDAAERTGLEDVLRAARQLARETRGLAESAGGVVERELAMALSVAESLRDRLVSEEALKQARAQPLIARLRTDAHRAVDLGMDAIATSYVFGVDLVENFIDKPRPQLELQKAAG